MECVKLCLFLSFNYSCISIVYLIGLHSWSALLLPIPFILLFLYFDWFLYANSIFHCLHLWSVLSFAYSYLSIIHVFWLYCIVYIYEVYYSCLFLWFNCSCILIDSFMLIIFSLSAFMKCSIVLLNDSFCIQYLVLRTPLRI